MDNTEMINTRFAISTWSVHGLLQSGLPLLDLPAQLANHGINSVEICHFHFPTTERPYLLDLESALREAGVELLTLLIDDGDIALPDATARAADLQMMRSWIEVASVMGAKRARIGAGVQKATSEVIERSAAALSELAEFAGGSGVDVITENWRTTGINTNALLEILDRCEGRVGLLADTGNAEGLDKYDTLAKLLPRSVSVHFKARYRESGEIDRDDLERCVGLMKEAKFDGPVSLIYAETQNEWAGVDRLKEALRTVDR
jgi:sugar phosphate isomerase/epimerase